MGSACSSDHRKIKVVPYNEPQQHHMKSISDCLSPLCTDSQPLSPTPYSSQGTKGVDSTLRPLKQLTILHFNDVYNIEEREREPVGGAARFKTAFDRLSNTNPLVLFSGDALAPSNMSVVTMGRQMIPILNTLQVQAAVYGNHEFDFGVDHLVDIIKQTQFPWLMTNVLCKCTGAPLAEGKEYHIIKWENIKIGLLGLVEEEWLATLPTLSIDDVLYTDYVVSAKHYIPILKRQGCELIIALTHMRLPNDKRLLESVPSIDLILGGHDHEYELYEINNGGTISQRDVCDMYKCTGRIILKSGSDFRNFSQLTVSVGGNSGSIPQISVRKHTVMRQLYPENKEVRSIVQQYLKSIDEGMDEVIGEIKCPLDGRFKSVRTQETNLGNLITDIMRAATRADCTLLNSGTLRSDTVHESGAFKMRDLMAILPMVDPLVVLQVTGQQLLEALENGVSQYPLLEGRFPQVSGLSFTFDPNRARGARVLRNTVTIRGTPLIADEIYKLCTKSYLADGKDGYTVLKSLPVLINEEAGLVLKNIVRNYFASKSHGSEGGEILSSTSAACSLSNEYWLADPAVAAPGVICDQPVIEGRINVYNN